MKLTILVENLKKVLMIAEKALARSSTMPILNSFLLKADSSKNKLIISATNLEIGIETSISAKIEKEGEIVVPSKNFLSFFYQLSDPKAEIQSEGKILKIKTDYYQANFQSYDINEFPIIPEIKTKKFLKIESNLLAQGFEQAIISAGISDLRPELNGIFLSFSKQGLKFAATDVFRLSEKTIPLAEIQTNFEENISCLIPLKTAQEISRIAKDKLELVEVYIEENQIGFKWEDTKFISRLLEGEFPEYSSIIPQSFRTKGVVSYNKLFESLKISGVFSSRLNDVKLKFIPKEKKLVLKSADSTIGENEAVVNFESAEGEEIEATFNYRYLLDGVSVLEPKDKVFIALADIDKPIYLKSLSDQSYFYILMPLRI